MRLKRRWLWGWDRFFQWAEKTEKVLFRLVLAVMVLLMVGQVLDTEDPLEKVISLTRPDGDPVYHRWKLLPVPDAERVSIQGEGSGDSLDKLEADLATVTLQLENFSSLAKAKVRVNGRDEADFLEKQVSVKVRPGDLLEVDGSFYNRAIRVKVLDTSPIIKSPREGGEYLIRSGVVQLGRVEFKERRQLIFRHH